VAPLRPRRALRLLGVEIRIDVSWLLIAGLIAWSLATGELPALHAGLPPQAYWATALMIAAGLGASILLHEMAHTLAARAFGLSVGRITLYLFGGVAELEDEPATARAELLTALAGPGFSVAFSGLLAIVAGATSGLEGPASVVLALSYLAAVNLILAGFNLLPAFPMDGGRVLRAVVWMIRGDFAAATRLAVRTGQAIAIGLMALGAVQALTGRLADGVWLALIGLFVHRAASAEIRRAPSRSIEEAL
jgi:Zn-dependent protease